MFQKAGPCHSSSSTSEVASVPTVVSVETKVNRATQVHYPRRANTVGGYEHRLISVI